MASLTLPTPETAIGKGTCPNCGKEITVKIDPVWYQQLLKLLKLINDSL